MDPSLMQFGMEEAPGPAEVSLSVARLTLLQSALDLLKTCPEGFLDGQALSNQLRELHPDHVAEVTSVNPRARKGWLRQLLANEPLILQLLPPGSNDVCYTLQHKGNVPAALAGAKYVKPGASIPDRGSKRRAAALPAGLPDGAKKQRKDHNREDINTVADRIPWGPKTEILSAAAEVTRTEALRLEQDYLEGNKISELLKEQCASSVGIAREAVGGKGWLRAILETSEEFVRVDVPGKAEPCYRLTDGTMPPMAQPASAVAVPRTVPSKGKGQRPAIVATPMQRPQVVNNGFLPMQFRQQLVQAAMQILGGADRGFLEGSRLSDQLRNFFPDAVMQARGALGDQKGKGWLKKLFESESSIQTVQVESSKEPCYCLVGQAHRAAAMGQAMQGMQANQMMVAPANQRMVAPAMAQKGAATPSAARKGASKGAKQQAPEASLADKAAIEGLIPYLTEAAVSHLSAVSEYMQGTKLAEALKEQYSDLVEKTKASLGGKGWLKKVMGEDPRIMHVKVQGLNEPCYALADRCVGGNTAFQRTQAPKRERAPSAGAEGRPPRQGPPTGENVLERISGEDAAVLYNSAVEVMEATGAGQDGYLEGSKLAEKMKALQPELVERVKSTLRKGWLKAVLELEPRIQAVEVEGRDEPCYRVVAL